MAFALAYTGVEGLTVGYAVGETETVGSEADVTTMKASYAIWFIHSWLLKI